MGQTLTAPVVEKISETGDNNALCYGVSEMQGWRVSMEDSHSISIKLGDIKDEWCFFSIFDGHAGTLASQYCSKNLLEKVKNLFKEYEQNPSNFTNSEHHLGVPQVSQSIINIKQALYNSFIELDEDMRKESDFQSDPISCGTTALALIITEDSFIFANCGDSRAILCRNDQVFFNTEDHKPSSPIELQRINRAGGHVSLDRVNGSLAVSRALGDFSFKTNADLKSTEQTVSPEPTIYSIPRDSSDQFIILACDGVWDVLSNEQACSFVLSRLRVESKLSKITDSILDTCLFLNSHDNMTCVLIRLPGAPTVDEELVAEDILLEDRIKTATQNLIKENSSGLTAYLVLKKITQEFHDIDDLVIYSKAKLIIDILDTTFPNRDKTKDYSSSMFQPLPNTIQYIKSVISGCNVAIDSESSEDN